MKERFLNNIKEFYNRLKASPVLVKSIAATIWTAVAPTLGLPDWAQVGSIVLAVIYILFGLGNNPTDPQNY